MAGRRDACSPVSGLALEILIVFCRLTKSRRDWHIAPRAAGQQHTRPLAANGASGEAQRVECFSPRKLCDISASLRCVSCAGVVSFGSAPKVKSYEKTKKLLVGRESLGREALCQHLSGYGAVGRIRNYGDGATTDRGCEETHCNGRSGHWLPGLRRGRAIPDRAGRCP